MTITLQPDQERAIGEAIRAGAFRSVDEFIETAIATQSVRSVQDESAHSRPSSISSLMESSPSARPSRNSHKRDLRSHNP